MQLQEVNTPETIKEFLQLPLRLYKDDKNWIRPLDADIEKVFDPKQNRTFKSGKCTRWILWNDNKTEVIGRIAAFIDERTSKKEEQPTGGVGFFECVDNQDVANFMFDHCKQWLQNEGMEAMDGPINFGERNNWWGLLVEGFTPPIYQMNYNLPYYQKLFENYGWQLYFNQYSFGLRVSDPRPPKYVALWPSFKNDPDYTFTNAKKNNLEKYAEDFRKIYNAAWVKHSGVKEMSQAQAMKIMKAIKPIMVEHLMQFAYYKDEPIGMYISIPDLNQYFKHVNGKMDLLGKLKFLWYAKTGKRKKIVSIVFGVDPKFHGKGIDGMMVMNLHDYIKNKEWWDEVELTWIGDFNPKMLRIAENLNGKIIKTHITYRYLFDRNKEFKRYPIIH